MGCCRLFCKQAWLTCRGSAPLYRVEICIRHYSCLFNAAWITLNLSRRYVPSYTLCDVFYCPADPTTISTNLFRMRRLLISPGSQQIQVQLDDCDRRPNLFFTLILSDFDEATISFKRVSKALGERPSMAMMPAAATSLPRR